MIENYNQYVEHIFLNYIQDVPKFYITYREPKYADFVHTVIKFVIFTH